VSTNADVLSFPEGGVLVTAVASPPWDAAVVPGGGGGHRPGGITGHLANVARNLGCRLCSTPARPPKRSPPGCSSR